MRRSSTQAPSPPDQRTWPSARTLLKDRAYAELKELIQSGVFPPNAFLSERQLVERMGMSKTPIRSALEHLESQGLVVVSPQQGIVVKDLSAQEITELFDMRTAIEPFVVSRLSERRLSPGDVARVKANLRLQGMAAAAEDALESTRLDIAFHTMLAELLDNREAIVWLSRCFDKLHRSILRINRLAAGRLEKSHQDHRAIAKSILARKPADAAQAMMEHLRYGRGFLQNEST